MEATRSLATLKELREAVHFETFGRNPWGNVFYVDSSHTHASNVRNSGRKFDHPLETLKYALTLASAYDTILLGAGHTETIDSAGDITVSLNDISIIGLGIGNRRPTFTFSDVTTATMVISGAGNLLRNVRLVCGMDSLVTMVNVTGADNWLDQIEILDDATKQTIDAITLTATADRCKLTGIVANQATAAAGSCINIVGADRVEVSGCVLYGDYSSGCIENVTVAASRVEIHHNTLENLNVADCCIALVATATGNVYHNNCRVATDGEVTWITAGTDANLYENYGVNADGETGMIVGTASTA